MEKRVEVGDLKLGMYVSELDCPWSETPFAPPGFTIRTPEQITQLLAQCAYVYIKTGLTTSEPEVRSDPLLDPSAFYRLDRPELELEILKKYAAPGSGQNKYHDTCSIEDEINEIRRAHKQALELVDDLMHAVRLGGNLDATAAIHIVSLLADSIIRNPDALVCFTHLRQTHAATAEHGLRSCILALALGRHLGMAKQQLTNLGIGMLLHDIGKTRVPQEILECGHERNEEERRILRMHVSDGVAILESTEGIDSSSIEVARQHHEHYDGSGYPRGLCENEISQFGHIAAIIDRYDNLTCPLPGRRAVPPHKALKILYELRGKLFHPHLTEEFIRCMGIYPIGSIVEMRTGEVGVVIALNRMRRLKPRVSLIVGTDQSYRERPQIVDLAHYHNQHGEALEIVRVADSNTYEFDPLDYLPVVA